jgi:thymidine kinase
VSQLEGLHCILVDESQFLSSGFVDHLRWIASALEIPVLCYGLRTDFQTHLFEGSKRLLELCDSLEEVKNTCQRCNKKAIFNMRTVNGRGTLDGPQILLGVNESYDPVCAECFEDELSLFRPPSVDAKSAEISITS